MTMFVNLSAPQDSHMGCMLNHLYYCTNFLSLLSKDTICTGYPHNGGQHTLHISGSSEEIFDFINLLKDEYPGKPAEELEKVRKVLVAKGRASYMSLEDKELK